MEASRENRRQAVKDDIFGERVIIRKERIWLKALL